MCTSGVLKFRSNFSLFSVLLLLMHFVLHRLLRFRGCTRVVFFGIPPIVEWHQSFPLCVRRTQQFIACNVLMMLNYEYIVCVVCASMLLEMGSENPTEWSDKVWLLIALPWNHFQTHTLSHRFATASMNEIPINLKVFISNESVDLWTLQGFLMWSFLFTKLNCKLTNIYTYRVFITHLLKMRDFHIIWTERSKLWNFFEWRREREQGKHTPNVPSIQRGWTFACIQCSY